MSPVNHRGRRRLDPEAPVERLRGLLANDAEDQERHQAPESAEADQESTAWTPPVRWKVPWAAVLLALVALLAVGLSLMWPDQDDSGAAKVSATIGSEPAGSPSPVVASGATKSPGGPAAGSPETVFVHVVGEVHRPGVVEIPGDGRVQDAVEAAGGLTSQAVVTHVNLAAPVADGAQISIPDADGDRELANNPVAVGPSAAPEPASSSSASTAAGSSGAPVNLNTATAAELETLPRVGPVMAQRIIEHRDQVGGFRSVEELDDVTGIGPAMLSALTPLVTV